MKYKCELNNYGSVLVQYQKLYKTVWKPSHIYVKCSLIIDYRKCVSHTEICHFNIPPRIVFVLIKPDQRSKLYWTYKDLITGESLVAFAQHKKPISVTMLIMTTGTFNSNAKIIQAFLIFLLSFSWEPEGDWLYKTVTQASEESGLTPRGKYTPCGTICPLERFSWKHKLTSETESVTYIPL